MNLRKTLKFAKFPFGEVWSINSGLEAIPRIILTNSLAILIAAPYLMSLAAVSPAPEVLIAATPTPKSASNSRVVSPKPLANSNKADGGITRSNPPFPSASAGDGVANDEKSTERDDGTLPSNTNGSSEKKIGDLERKVAGVSKKLDETNSWWTFLVTYIPTLFGLCTLFVLGYLLYRNVGRSFRMIAKDLDIFRKKNNDLTRNVEAYMKVSTDLSQQLANHKSEIAKLKQLIESREIAASFSPPPPIPDFQSREQPRFPVSVDDYLAKHRTDSLSVKYDYKEGTLIRDSGDEGGLIVVQDGGRLYLVPSFGFFQTKSDYTNHFERYYSCDRPMGGNVWIKQPATVVRVDGGWRLDSPGELEVR